MTLAVTRAHLNFDLLSTVNHYAFIDHTRSAGNRAAPYQTQYAASTLPYTQMLDSNGWPNNSDCDGKQIDLGSIRLPAANQFAGPYVLTWDGSGRIQLSGMTITNGTNNGSYTFSGGNYTAVNGLKARATFTVSGTTVPTALVAKILNTGGADGFVRNVNIYRLEDETDFLAGKIFRRAFKQIYVDFNPQLIRFMNITGINGSLQTRFENRNKPEFANWVNNFMAGPRYGDTSGVNQMTLAAVTGTSASMQHGEIATCRIGSSMVRGGQKAVTSISKANPGVVVCTGHGFNTGDVIIHCMESTAAGGSTPAGMVQLDKVPCTITLDGVDPTNKYSIGIDTTGYTTFTVGTAYQYLSLQVGTGNDRVAYPIFFGDGVSPASRYGVTYLAAGEHRTFVFNKDIVCNKTLGAGAWFTEQNPSSGGMRGMFTGAPIEVCTAFVNELMEMLPAGKGPIDMWMNIPHTGLCSFDQDYSAASNWPVGLVDVVLNPSSTLRTLGYSSLNTLCKLFVEHSNETWNTSFNHTPYLARLGDQRSAGSAGSAADLSTYSTLRAVKSFRDIKAAFPGESRLKFVMGQQGFLGAGSSQNSLRLTGSTKYFADALNTWGTAPYVDFDYTSPAHYFTIQGLNSVSTALLISCTADWVAAAGDPAAQEAACAAYVVGLVGTNTSTQTTSWYAQTLLPGYATAALAVGKKVISYEGELETYSPGLRSANEILFFAAVRRSKAWAQAFLNFMNTTASISGYEGPSVFSMIGNIWGHCDPDTYSSTVEGGGLDLAWNLQRLRNNSKRRLTIRT